MQHVLNFNKNSPIILEQENIRDMDILIKEFDFFHSNFVEIFNKLGSISIIYGVNQNNNFKFNYHKTFTKHTDFVSACTILRPFLLQEEGYYAKANAIIRKAFNASKNNNIILTKNLDILIPKQLSSLNKYSEVTYENKEITSYFKQDKNKQNSKIFNVMKKYLKDDYIIKLNNYEFFDIYLYAFVFHRDQEFQHFIINVIGIKDIICKDIENSSTLFIIQNFYSICIQILQTISNMDVIIHHIYNHINNKKDLSISYFDESDSEFGIIKFN